MRMPRDTIVDSALGCILAMLFLMAYLTLAGCTQSQTREQTATDKVDKISVSGTLTIPTAEGPKPVPVSFTIDRRGTEDARKESDTRSSIDGAAIGREVAAALAPIMASTGGPSLLSILGTAGAGLTAATTGYLALKKREQLRPEKKRA